MTELLMGAVAYDPKVVTIWDGFRAWFAQQGLPFDYLLYSNYERQVEDLLAGRIHAAWNSPPFFAVPPVVVVPGAHAAATRPTLTSAESRRNRRRSTRYRRSLIGVPSSFVGRAHCALAASGVSNSG